MKVPEIRGAGATRAIVSIEQIDVLGAKLP